MLYAAILFLVCLILIAFVRHRMHLKSAQTPLPPDNTDASLSIKKFSHIATKNGEKQWSLEASSASLFAEKNMARLTDISVIFYLKDNKELVLRADNGQLNSKTNDMTISGNIIATMPEYTLITENLYYNHRRRIININTPVTVSGSLIRIKADTMTYNMQTNKIKCIGHVEGTFFENFEW